MGRRHFIVVLLSAVATKCKKAGLPWALTWCVVTRGGVLAAHLFLGLGRLAGYIQAVSGAVVGLASPWPDGLWCAGGAC